MEFELHYVRALVESTQTQACSCAVPQEAAVEDAAGNGYDSSLTQEPLDAPQGRPGGRTRMLLVQANGPSTSSQPSTLPAEESAKEVLNELQRLQEEAAVPSNSNSSEGTSKPAGGTTSFLSTAALLTAGPPEVDHRACLLLCV